MMMIRALTAVAAFSLSLLGTLMLYVAAEVYHLSGEIDSFPLVFGILLLATAATLMIRYFSYRAYLKKHLN